MAEERHQIKVEGFTQIVSAAASAAQSVAGFEGSLDRINPAAGRARDALGRFVAGVGSGSQILKSSAGDVYQLADSYEVLPPRIDRVVASYQKLNYSADQIVTSWGKSTSALRGSAAELDGSFARTSNISESTQRYISRTGASAGVAGQRFLQFARTMDDARQFQYGFTAGLQGIGNNLVELNPKLGLITIALGVLAAAFVKNFDAIHKAAEGTFLDQPLSDWKSFFDSNIQWAGEFVGILDSAAEKAKNVAAEASKAVAAVRSPEEESRGKAVTDVVKRFGGGKAVQSLVEEEARRQKLDPAGFATPLAGALKGETSGISTIQQLLSKASGRAGLLGQEISGEISATNPEQAEAVKAIADEQKRLQAEAEAANRERESLIEERAKQFASGPLGTAVLGGQLLITDDIKNSFADAGEEVGDEFAEAVRRKLEETIGQQTRDRAIEAGLTLPEAAEAILTERTKEETKEALDREVKGAQALGLDQLATQAALGGARAGDVEEYLMKQFGLSSEVAGDLALSGSQAASEELAKGEPRRLSEITGDIASDIQQSIGAEDKIGKQIALAEEIRNATREVAANTKKDWARRPVINRRDF